MSNIHKNENGFGIVEALSVIVIAGMVAFTGWYVVHAKKDVSANLAISNSSTSVVKKPKQTIATTATAVHTQKEAEALVKGTLDQTQAYVTRTTNADQGEIDTAKVNLSPAFYSKLTTTFKNSTDSGGDPFICAQEKVPSYSLTSKMISSKEAEVTVTEAFNTPYDVFYSIDLTTLKITNITCSE